MLMDRSSPSGPQDIVAVPANAAAASSTPVATPTSEHFASCTGFGCPVPPAAATAPAVVSLSKADNPPAPARVDARTDIGAAAAKILAASFSKGGLPNAASEAKSAPTEEVEMPVGPETLVMRPGVNEIIPISVGQMNRIITPFTHAEVVTASGVQPEIRDSTIYLAPGDDKIITFFVTEKGSEGVALSLTLVPKAIPPREIRLELPTETKAAIALAEPVGEKAKWEEQQPYLQTIRDVFRSVALGTIPSGYSLRGVEPTDRLPTCRSVAGLIFNFESGQVLVGGRLQVFVGTVANRGASPQEVVESSCADHDTAGVAIWPRPLLEPGRISEVYVLERRDLPEEHKAVRPLLVGGGS